MHDLKKIEADYDAFADALRRRSVTVNTSEILTAALNRKSAIGRLEASKQAQRQAEINARNVVLADAERHTFSSSEEKKQFISNMIVSHMGSFFRYGAAGGREASEQLATAEVTLKTLLSGLPNLPAPDVPDGPDESANVEVARWGTPPSFDFTPAEHPDFAPALGLDFEAGVAIAGARFSALRGGMARLHRALGQFMLDMQVDAHGYQEVVPPLLVRDEAMFGTGQLPKFADDLFRTTDGRWLIPTAEVSVTNLVRERILDEAALPLRFTALTPCFRSEAGAAGRDTRGLIRQHQFEKVELVAITTPETSADTHEAMTRHAEVVLEALNLPYRRMLLCAGDMGFSAMKTYDLEVWLPGQNRYREISSISNCGDFQARRMDARYRTPGEKGTRFVHTLNGSGLAVGRALVAVLENYQQGDGSVRVPDVLARYMGGLALLRPA